LNSRHTFPPRISRYQSSSIRTSALLCAGATEGLPTCTTAPMAIAAKYGVDIGPPEDREWKMRDFVMFDPCGVVWRVAQDID
jgi:hypothetical protein